LPYWTGFLGIDKFFAGAQAFIYRVFITRVTSLASSLQFSVGLGLSIWPWPHSSLACLTSSTEDRGLNS